MIQLDIRTRSRTKKSDSDSQCFKESDFLRFQLRNPAVNNNLCLETMSAGPSINMMLNPLSTWCWILYQHDAESSINMMLNPLSTWCWILYQHDAESSINMMLNPLSTWCWILYQHDLKLKLPFHCSTKVRVKINLQSWHKRSNLTKLKLEGVDHSFFYKFKINW